MCVCVCVYMFICICVYLMMRRYKRLVSLFMTLDSTSPDTPVVHSIPISSHAHFSITLHSPSTSSSVLPACRHSRTRSVPVGTVGATIGRSRKPCRWQHAASSRADAVNSGTMGDSGTDGATCRMRGGIRRRRHRSASEPWARRTSACKARSRSSAKPPARCSYVVWMAAREG